MRTLLVLLFSLVSFAGCASGGGAGSAGGDRNVLTAEDLEAYPGVTLYDAIRRARPQWLRARPSTTGTGGGGGSGLSNTSGTPVLHLDGSRHDDLSALQGLRAADVARVEYLSAADATTRFGTGYVNGALLVTTSR